MSHYFDHKNINMNKENSGISPNKLQQRKKKLKKRDDLPLLSGIIILKDLSLLRFSLEVTYNLDFKKKWK